MNFKKYYSVIFLCPIIYSPIPLQADWDEGTSQNLFIKSHLDENWFFASRNNFATRDGINDLFLGYIDVNLGYKLSPNWSAEIGYRHVWLKRQQDWTDEARPLLNLTWRNQYKDISLSNRGRLEFRDFKDERKDRIRFRNETIVSFKNAFTSPAITPFLSEELFFEFTDDGFNLNWLTAGIKYELSRQVGMKLGYRWQAQKFSGTWNHRHVLVTGISLIF